MDEVFLLSPDPSGSKDTTVTSLGDPHGERMMLWRDGSLPGLGIPSKWLLAPREKSRDRSATARMQIMVATDPGTRNRSRAAKLQQPRLGLSAAFLFLSSGCFFSCKDGGCKDRRGGPCNKPCACIIAAIMHPTVSGLNPTSSDRSEFCSSQGFFFIRGCCQPTPWSGTQYRLLQLHKKAHEPVG